MGAAARGRKGEHAPAIGGWSPGLPSRRPPDMPEEAGFPPAKRFRPGCGPPGGRVVMLLTAGGGGCGGRRQQSAQAQPAASPYPEAVERQRRSLPIFPARGQLLAQLRNLDSAVLIGEWPEGLGVEAPPRRGGACRGLWGSWGRVRADAGGGPRGGQCAAGGEPVVGEPSGGENQAGLMRSRSFWSAN